MTIFFLINHVKNLGVTLHCFKKVNKFCTGNVLKIQDYKAGSSYIQVSVVHGYMHSTDQTLGIKDVE